MKNKTLKINRTPSFDCYKAKKDTGESGWVDERTRARSGTRGMV